MDDSGKEYDVLRRGAVDDIYSETNADITKLQQLTEQKVEDSHNYTYFSYLEYDKQFERAKVMIQENSYTQKQVDSQSKQLEKAKSNLISVEKEVQLLKKVLNGNYQAAAMTAFDSLLREMLSCQKYVNGRSNTLKYSSIYRNKSIECTFSGKRKSIQKAYNNLMLYL